MSDARIFINYRRADSAGWAGRLHDDLAARFGRDRVFRDVGMSPGVPFRAHIDGVLDSCAVLVAVIGPEWGTVTNAEGYRRLDDPRDLVRREIVRALERQDVQVIPVLVDGARMPAESDLPADLAPLTWINACELSDSRWNYDVDRLEAQIASDLGDGGPAAAPAPAGSPRRAPLALTPAIVGAAGLGAYAAALLTAPMSDGRAQRSPERALGDRLEPALRRLGEYAPERAIIWATVGALALCVGTLVVRWDADRRSAVWPAVVGATVGAIAGAAGGAVYVVLKDVPNAKQPEWLLHAASVAVTGAGVGAAFARLARVRAETECRLAGLVGGVAAGALTGALFSHAAHSERALDIAMEAVIVAGAIAATLAAVEADAHAPAADDALPASPPLVR
jgi:TIR domain